MSTTLPDWLDVRTLRWLADNELREAEYFKRLGISKAVENRRARAVKLRTYATRVERKQRTKRKDGA